MVEQRIARRVAQLGRTFRLSREDQEDCRANAYLYAARALHSYDPATGASLESWLTIRAWGGALEQAETIVRRRAWYGLVSYDDGGAPDSPAWTDADDDAELRFAAPEPGPEAVVVERLARREREDRLDAMLRRLPEPYREVLELRFYQQLQHREIARRLRLTESGVGYRLRGALQMLRERAGELEDLLP